MATNKHIIDVQTRGAEKSQKQIKGVSGALGSMAKSAALAAGAYFGTKMLLDGIQKSIDAFAKQELAEKKLRFAAGASTKELIRQAQALQQVTRFGDEAIIGQQAYVKSLGISTEQTKEIIAASVDLAAAMGISLESAVMNTTKTLSGMQGELGEKLPAAFKLLTAEQLKAGEGIVFIREQFKGTAEEETQTLTGSLDQMSNAVGDAAEAFGSLLSPVVSNIAGFFQNAAEKASDFFRDLTETRLEKTIREMQELGISGEKLIRLQNLQISKEIKETNKELKELNSENLSSLQIEETLKNITQDKKELMGEISDLEATDITQREKEYQNELTRINTRFNREKELLEDQNSTRGDFQALEQRRLETLRATREFFNITEVDGLRAKLEQLELEELRLAEIQAREEKLVKLNSQKIKQTFVQKESTKKLTAFERELANIKEQTTAKGASDEYQAALNSSKAHLIKQIMKHIRFPFNIALAAGAGANIDKLFAKNSIKAAQYGADFVTDGPQMMMVGEGSGPERVQVTPLVDPNLDGPQGSGMIINIQGSVIGTEQFTEDVLMPQIEEGLRLGNRI